MNNMILKAWFGAALSMLSALFPQWFAKEQVSPISTVVLVAHAKPAQTARPAVKPVVKRVVPPAPAPSYIVQFEGKAILAGEPVANAEVLIWVVSSKTEQVRRARTRADGTFQLEIGVDARSNEPVDWEIRAHASDLKTAQRGGRQILLQGEPNVVIPTTLTF